MPTPDDVQILPKDVAPTTFMKRLKCQKNELIGMNNISQNHGNQVDGLQIKYNQTLLSCMVNLVNVARKSNFGQVASPFCLDTLLITHFSMFINATG